MKKMYRVGGLVHADLSEYNMLWHKDQLYFIDVSQAVDHMHPKAAEFLLRDCANVVQVIINQSSKNNEIHKCIQSFETDYAGDKEV